MYKEQIMAELDKVVSSKQIVDEQTGEGYFNKTTAPLISLEDHLREQIQAETSQQISAIINKLVSDDTVADPDLELIKLWIVGDAAAYIQMENDFKGWLQEFNRLVGEIEQLKAKELSLENMFKLSGVARDAVRVAGDIIFFKQQQERVEKFENAAKDLNSDGKVVLANILKQKLESDQI